MMQLPVVVSDNSATTKDNISTKRALLTIVHFIHENFLVILVGAYAAAACFPALGLLMRDVHFGCISLPAGGGLKISLSMLMLSFLLLNAGLGVNVRELIGLWKRPLPIVCGFSANILVPILLVLSMRSVMPLWHSNDELQSLLVGLAMICSMPIAGSSTAWSQNANGNISLSLGLVFLSTILSPLTTPVVLNLFSAITTGGYSSNLHEIANQGTNAFMMISVVLPSITGIMLHFLIGDARLQMIKPHLKLTNFVVLLLLNYSNASTALPSVLRNPDYDFLVLIMVATAALCFTAFFAGWGIAKILKTDRSEKAALMFGLGMNNNGTGLVLAASTLGGHPAVLLPMIFYTLVQQVVAALVDFKLFKTEA